MIPKVTNTELLLQSLQRTNRLLRQRAIIIGVLMIIAWGVLQASKSDYDKSIKYYEYIVLLEHFKETKDLKKFIEADSLRPLYFIIDTEELYFKIEKANYTDRTPIVEAIATIKQLRNEFNKGNKTINIFGLDVPIKPWLYLSPLIILILFHDFTETIFYRKTLQQKAESTDIEDWEKGPELFGFHSYKKRNAESAFLQAISTILIVLFLLCPLITSVLFIIQVFGNYHYSDEGKPGSFLMIVSWGCFFIVMIDTILIFYHENILNFKKTIDLLAGQLYAGDGIKTRPMEARIITIVLLLLLQLIVILPSVFEADLFMIIVYYLLVIFSVGILYISLAKSDNNTYNKYWKAIRFWAVLINTFWVLVFLFVILNFKTFHTNDIKELTSLFVIFSFVTIIIAPPLYLKFIHRNEHQAPH